MENVKVFGDRGEVVADESITSGGGVDCVYFLGWDVYFVAGVGSTGYPPASLGENYLWTNGETTQAIYVKESGTYSVVHINSNSCTSLPSPDVVVTVSDFLTAPIIVINGSSSICEGESVELSVELS